MATMPFGIDPWNRDPRRMEYEVECEIRRRVAEEMQRYDQQRYMCSPTSVPEKKEKKLDLKLLLTTRR